MTNFIEKLKQAAAGRTKGRWKFYDSEWNRTIYAEPDDSGDNDLLVCKSLDKCDGIAITEAMNCFDELVAVAEALNACEFEHQTPCSLFDGLECDCNMMRFKEPLDALASLRQKVEGEGG